MSETANIWSTTAVRAGNVSPGTAAATAIEQRGDIMQMTQIAEDAVLRPAEPGAWPHELRLALACRMARLNGSDSLADRYAEMSEIYEFQSVADPAAEMPDELKTCLAFIDRVSTSPRDISAEDIKILQDVEISDADIVRLTELAAFMAYQIRLVAGLALIGGAAA